MTGDPIDLDTVTATIDSAVALLRAAVEAERSIATVYREALTAVVEATTLAEVTAAVTAAEAVLAAPTGEPPPSSGRRPRRTAPSRPAPERPARRSRSTSSSSGAASVSAGGGWVPKPGTIGWEALVAVADQGGTWEGNVAALAAVLPGTAPAATVAIRKVERAGLVQLVRTSPRKVTSVCLTRAGWDLLGRIPPYTPPVDGEPPTPAPLAHEGMTVLEVLEEADVDLPTVDRRAAARDAAAAAL